MRPSPDSRRLLPCQSSEPVVADVTTGAITVIYDTLDLFEAPNWTRDNHLIYNADGRLWHIFYRWHRRPHRVNTAPVENLNYDHVLSPDGKSIFLSANDGHLYSAQLNGGLPTQVSRKQESTRNYRHYLHGVSPDGMNLACVAYEDGPMMRIATIPATGGPTTYLTDGTCPVDGPEYSPDGAWLYFNGELAAAHPVIRRFSECAPMAPEPNS